MILAQIILIIVTRRRVCCNLTESVLIKRKQLVFWSLLQVLMSNIVFNEQRYDKGVTQDVHEFLSIQGQELYYH